MNEIKVHTTKDYSLFKTIEGNRPHNELHIERLKKSMAEEYLMTVIIVNEKYQIIDGQHRFQAIKELKLPLYYIICRGYKLPQVQKMNVLNKTWIPKDYMEGYASMGMEDYIIYRDFKEKYKFGHNETMAMLCGGAKPSLQFTDGTFKVKSLDHAIVAAESVNLFKNYSGYRRRSFVFAIMQLLRNPNFRVAELARKVEMYPTMLVDCTTSSNYIKLIEDIYNYKNRKKINLRY